LFLKIRCKSIRSHAHTLTLLWRRKIGALQHTDVQESIRTTVIAGDEAKTLLAVEKLHGT
jgi:hypothetical protein